MLLHILSYVKVLDCATGANCALSFIETDLLCVKDSNKKIVELLISDMKEMTFDNKSLAQTLMFTYFLSLGNLQ